MIREERSLSLVSSISATISSTVRAVDSMAPVKGYVVRHNQGSVTFHNGTGFGKIQVYNLYFFQADVLPDIQFRPVGQRKDTDAFSRIDTTVINVP